MERKKNIALIGAGGHAKVIVDIIYELNKYNIIGFFDDNKMSCIYDIENLGTTNDINLIKHNIDCYIIAIGDNFIRKKIFDQNVNLIWETLIHPRAVVARSAIINSGTIVCAGAVVQTDVKIGKHCIINTNCSVDHESMIGDFNSICPGATLCGNVIVGNFNFIGANAVIIQKIKICDECIIGAGAVVIRDVLKNNKLVGNPAINI